MAIVKVILEHNKNVLEYLKMMYGENNITAELKNQNFYTDPVFDILSYKDNLVSLYNTVIGKYNRMYALAELQLEYIKKEQEKIDLAPQKIEELKNEKLQLEKLLSQKDENYKKCVELYLKKLQAQSDLTAVETYEEVVVKNEQRPKTVIKNTMIYNPTTKTMQPIPTSSIAYETVEVKTTVTKTRADIKKIEQAQKDLAQIEEEIKNIPTFDKNIEAFEAENRIHEIENNIKELNEYLKVAESIKDGYIVDYQSCVESAKQLLKIIEKEKELIEKVIKNPKKYDISAVKKDINELEK